MPLLGMHWNRRPSWESNFFGTSRGLVGIFVFLFGLLGVRNMVSLLPLGSFIVFGTAQEQIVNYLVVLFYYFCGCC